MQPFDISLLMTACGAAGLIVYHLSVAKELRQARRETSRFEMFAVRDRLVDLVATGKMAEADSA